MFKIGFKRAALITLCLVFAVILLVYSHSFSRSPQSEVISLQNWTELNNASESFDLPHALNPDKDGIIQISTVLPENADSPRYICFWTYYSAVDVLIGEENVYHYNNVDIDAFGSAPTSRWHFVNLPEGYGGKQLTISIDSPYQKSNTRLAGVIYGDLLAVYRWINQKYYLFSLLDNIILTIGIVIVALSYTQKGKHPHKNYQVYIGAFTILLSLFLHSCSKAPTLGIMPLFAKDFIRYLSMFTLSIPFTLYIEEKLKTISSAYRFFLVLFIAEVSTTIAAFTLHTLKVVDIHHMLPLGLLLFFVTMLSAFVVSITAFTKKRNWYRLCDIVSCAIVLFIFVIEFMQFYCIEYIPFDPVLVSRIGISIVLILGGYSFVHYTKKETEKQLQLEEEHRNLKLQMLTENIRPHFILNTIGAIRTLIPTQPEKAANLLLDFSSYVRERLEQKDYYKPVPFLEELDNIRTYLSLEKARFGDTIEVFYNCTDTQFRILPLTVQPFVENAIKHGLFTVKDGGKLWISSEAVNGKHKIEIIDNGTGFDTAQLEQAMQSKKAMGLRSAVLRLENEMNATVSIESSSDIGTRVKIIIP